MLGPLLREQEEFREASLALPQVKELQPLGSALLGLAARCFLLEAYLDSTAQASHASGD